MKARSLHTEASLVPKHDEQEEAKTSVPTPSSAHNDPKGDRKAMSSSVGANIWFVRYLRRVQEPQTILLRRPFLIICFNLPTVPKPSYLAMLSLARGNTH